MMHVDEGRIRRDDWTSITAKRERKKRQNRLNQRALRERKRQDEIRLVSGNKPYQVSRWRLGQPKEQHNARRSSATWDARLSSSSPQGSGDYPNLYVTERSPCELEGQLLPLVTQKQTNPSPKSYRTPPESVNFPLSADHLIRLIHQNVFAALMNNKSVLVKTTYLTRHTPQAPSIVIPPSQDYCDGMTLIHRIIERPLPQSLQPTALQSTIPHSSWLNMFPWPRFRDNLIVHESIIDAAELLYDLVGDLVNYHGPKETDIDIPGLIEDDEDMHKGRRGLIVWGEPWDTEGWEVTLGFMKKWSWLLNGCEEVLEVSNRWRAKRNEEPLRWQAVLD